jgi:hypothetical protein
VSKKPEILKFDPKVGDEIANLIRMGNFVEVAAKCVGISKGAMGTPLTGGAEGARIGLLVALAIVACVPLSGESFYIEIVGKVLVTDPTCQRQCPKTLDAGLAQVTAGLAWWYRKYAKEQSAEDAQRYELAEQEARSHRAGLWSDGQPMPPWDWRKAAR